MRLLPSTPIRAYLAAAVLLVLGGCAEMNSVHRRSALPESRGEIVTVDAKQRHLLILPEYDTAGTRTRWRVCAEAAPDVYSAFATSLALRGDKHGGEASLGSAEAAGSIERTQTINMIRERFYRTCELYASGAINRTQFVIQAARDQRSMIAILAIEQLTGAVRPKSTIITGPLTAASVLSGSGAADLVKDYDARLKAALAERDKAATAVAEAEKDGGVCGKTEGKDEAACAVLKARVTAAQGAADKAQAGLDEAVKLVNAAVASAGGGTILQGGGVSLADIDQGALASVAQAVVAIAANSQINEPLMFCIGYLSDPDANLLSGPQTLARDDQVRIVQGCLTMLEEQQRGDKMQQASLLSGLVLTPSRGAQEERLAHYLRPGLPGAEMARRMGLARQAAGQAGLDATPTGIMRLLVAGPESDRARLTEALRKIERDPAGSADLGQDGSQP